MKLLSRNVSVDKDLSILNNSIMNEHTAVDSGGGNVNGVQVVVEENTTDTLSLHNSVDASGIAIPNYTSITTIAPTVTVIQEIPTCYDFSNQNICGEHWFIATDVQPPVAAASTAATDDVNVGNSIEEVSNEVNSVAVSVPIKSEIIPKTCYTYIQTLILQNNQIECFNWELLLELQHLVELDLSHNKITHIIDSIIYMGTFSSKPNYKALAKKIHHASKTAADVTISGKVKQPLLTVSEQKMYLHASLKRLDLSYNNIEKCGGLVSLISVEESNLSHNNIKIPEGIPCSTVRLDISNKFISSIIAVRMFGLCKQITAIDMTNNAIGSRDILVSILPGLLEYNGTILPRSHDISNRGWNKAEKKLQEAQVLRYEKVWQKHSKSFKTITNSASFSERGQESQKPLDKTALRRLQHQSDVSRSK